MITCKIGQGPKISGSNLKFESNGTYEESNSGKHDILILGSNQYLKVQERGLKFDGVGDYIDFSFKVSGRLPSAITILEGQRIPLTLSLLETDNDYVLRVSFVVMEKYDTKLRLSAESVKKFKTDTWYRIRILLLSGEVFVLVDNEPCIRRTFEFSLSQESYGELIFRPSRRSSTGTLRITDIAFSGEIYLDNQSELFTIANKAADNGFYVVENTYWDQRDYGVDLGDCTEKIADKYNNTYYVYEKGAILLSKEKECIYLITPLYKIYRSQIDRLGFPKKQVEIIPDRSGNAYVTYAMSEGHAVFYMHREDRTWELSGDTLTRYLAVKPSEYSYWYPITGEIKKDDSDTIDIRSTVFSNNLVICEIHSGESDPHAVIMPKVLYTFFWRHYLDLNLGYPLMDYTVYYGRGGAACYKLACKNFWLHYFPKWDKYLITEDDIGEPLSNEEKNYKNHHGNMIRAYNFTNGVVVYYPGTGGPVFHSGLLMRFDKVTTGEIDDGINSVAELYIKLSVMNKDGYVVKEKRLGKRSYSEGSRNYVFNQKDGYNEFTISPLHSDDYFTFKIDLYDYDPEAGNDDDFIGTFWYTYNIYSGWGMDRCDGIDDIETGLHVLELCIEGKDNRGGFSNCKLHLAFANTYDLEKLKKNPRKYLAFPFRNFTGAYDFNEDDFQRVFSNVRYEWWNLGWMYDLIFYSVCKYKIKGAKCFGIAVAELSAIHGEGSFIPPLNRFVHLKNTNKTVLSNLEYDDLLPDVAHRIVDYYIHQFGWDFLMWQWRKMCADEYLIPHRAIDSIKKRLDKESFCTINIKPVNMNGHAVLAYGYSGSGINTKIHVMDCNKPYNNDDEDDPNPSYICFENINSVQDKVRVKYIHDPEYGTDSDEDYRYLFETPFSIACRVPRVPNTLDIIFDALDNLMIGLIEGVGNLLGAYDLEGTLYEADSKIVDFKKMLPVYGYSGKNDDLNMFLIRDDNVRLKFRAKKTGIMYLKLGTPKTRIDIEIKLSKNEVFEIKTEHPHELHGMRLTFKKSGAPQKATIFIGQSGNNNAYSHQFKTNIIVSESKTILHCSKVGIRMRRESYDSRGRMIDAELIDELKTQKNNPGNDNDYEEPWNVSDPGAIVGNTVLTVSEYASMVNLSVSTIRRYCRNNRLSGCYKSGTKWMIPSTSRAIRLRKIKKKNSHS